MAILRAKSSAPVGTGAKRPSSFAARKDGASCRSVVCLTSGSQVRFKDYGWSFHVNINTFTVHHVSGIQPLTKMERDASLLHNEVPAIRNVNFLDLKKAAETDAINSLLDLFQPLIRSLRHHALRTTLVIWLPASEEDQYGDLSALVLAMKRFSQREAAPTGGQRLSVIDTPMRLAERIHRHFEIAKTDRFTTYLRDLIAEPRTQAVRGNELQRPDSAVGFRA